MKPKRVPLAQAGALLGLPEGASVASVGNDATTATFYVTGVAASRRVPLDELAGLLGLATIAALGTSEDDLVVFADDPEPPAPPATGATKKAGSS